MAGRMELNFTFGGSKAGQQRARRNGDEPFRLLLVGDFSGRAWKAARGERSALGRPLEVDAEAFDRAFAACNVTLPVDAGAGETVVSFGSLDDLHPDRLLDRLAVLAEPRRLRATLAGAAPGADTLAAAERWLTTQVNLAAPPPPTAGTPPPAAGTSAAAAASGESADAAVERLLGRAARTADPSGSAAGAGRADAASALGSLIASIVQPHVTPDPGPRRAQLLLALDEVISARLRAILSAPDFRAIEGAWRGVDRVVRALGTDAELRISLLDASRRDLLDAVSGGPEGNLEGSPLHRLLVADDRRFSLVAVDFEVALASDDLRLCAALGAVVGRGGGALVAGAGPSLLGCDTLDAVADPTLWRAPDQAPDGALWRALRESPLAPSIGLALPRVLARLPYGKKTDPVESFPFEEVGLRTGRAPDARVWSPAAFAIAEAYGAAFRAGGWEMDPSEGPFDLDDLPTHTYDDAGETRLFPPAETALSERAGSAVVASGLTAILARRDRGAARILGAASIATPSKPLEGPWLTRE